MTKALPSLLFALFASPALSQTTWIVDVSAAGPGTGTSADPYASVQYAVDQAGTVSGDTLMLLPGTYTENVDLSGKSLAIVGRDGPAATHIAAAIGAPILRMASGEGAGTRVEGLTIRDGIDHAPSGGEGLGIQVIGSTLEVADCVIRDQDAGFLGSGIYALNATLVVRNTTFTENRDVRNRGGCAYLEDSSASFTDCSFVDNGDWIDCGPVIATNGGDLEVRECHFAGNRGDLRGVCIWSEHTTLLVHDSVFFDNAGECDGVAVHQFGGSAVITECTFRFNSNPEGFGTVVAWETDLVMDDSLFDINTGNHRSFCAGLTLLNATSRITQTDFIGNWAGASTGVYLQGGQAHLEDCLFHDNIANHLGLNLVEGHSVIEVDVAGTIYLDRCRFLDNEMYPKAGEQGAITTGNVIHRNSTIVGNVSTDGRAPVVDGTLLNSIVRNPSGPSIDGTTTATYSNIKGGAPGAGNFDQDPLFGSNYELLPGSPCIDAGDPSSGHQADGSPMDVGASPWTWSGVGAVYCASNPNSTGLEGRLGAFGDGAANSGPLYLHASDLPTGTFGLFLVGNQGNNFPLGNGTLCVGGSIGRHGIRTTDAAGTMAQTVDKTALPQNPPVSIQPGDTWRFQAWHRDGSASNTTEAVTITFH